MLISCPSCASQYSLDPDRIGATGRVVRCASCREPWFIPGRMHDADVTPESIPAHAQARRAAASDVPSEPTRTFRRITASHLACFGLAAAMALCIGLRTQLVRFVPQTASVYAALGFPVNLVGLRLGEVESQVSQGPMGRVLTITADITNSSSRILPIPRVALAIARENGDVLYDWTAPAAETELEPGKSTRFEAKLASPPPEGRVVTITFSTADHASQVASR